MMFFSDQEIYVSNRTTYRRLELTTWIVRVVA